MTAIRAIRSADDVYAAAALIALAFDPLGANHYLVPDPRRRLRVMTDYFYLHAQHAADGAGKVLLAGEGNAVAVWFDRTREIGEPVNYSRRLAEAVGEDMPRFQELDKLLDAHHPGPCLHLAFLAVHPDWQGQGWGSALLEHTHAELDKAGIPSYLEATTCDNERLYRRHDYQTMHPSVITLPDGTPFYRMWRKPRGK